MSRYYLFINGINTDVEEILLNWNYRAERWVEDRTPDRADTYAYKVKTFTRWLKQGEHIDKAAACLTGRSHAKDDLILVGHSNGCAIAAGVLAKYPQIGVTELHLIAAAVDDSYDTNGLNECVARGQVGTIYLYCSTADEALKWARKTHWIHWLNSRWGYGSLGLTGPSAMTEESRKRTTVYWHENFNHSTYFDAGNFDNTMRSIAGADRLSPTAPAAKAPITIDPVWRPVRDVANPTPPPTPWGPIPPTT